VAFTALGATYVHLTNTGDYYSWRKVETFIHNIIVGKLWIDHHGRTTITNHRNKDNCELILQAKTRQVRMEQAPHLARISLGEGKIVSIISLMLFPNTRSLHAPPHIT